MGVFNKGNLGREARWRFDIYKLRRAHNYGSNVTEGRDAHRKRSIYVGY